MRPAFGQMLVKLGYADAWASADDREHTLSFTPPTEPEPAERARVPAWSDCELLISGVSRRRDAWAGNAGRAIAGLGHAAQLVCFEPRPPADYPGHVTEYHREQLAACRAGRAPPAVLPLVNPDGAILLHPGSGGAAKCWPQRGHFLALADDLVRNGLRPTFLLGEAEQERWAGRRVEELQGNHPTYLHMGLYELAERMKRARLCVGNDAGVTHLAARGQRMVALFGPSNVVQWRPVGPRVMVVRGSEAGDMGGLDVGKVLSDILVQLHC